MSCNEIFLTIQNHTDKQMATNVFNGHCYDWAKGTRPNTNIHERVICARTEIAELSQMCSVETSYQLGLTISDGSYLELTVNHGLKTVEVSGWTAALAQEMCGVSGDVSKYRVDRLVSGIEPWLLTVSIFEVQEDVNAQLIQQEVLNQTSVNTQSPTQQEIYQTPTDAQQEILDQNHKEPHSSIQHETLDQNTTDTQTVIQHENCDQNTTDEQTVIQHQNVDQNTTDEQTVIQHQNVDQNTTDTQTVIEHQNVDQNTTDTQTVIQHQNVDQNTTDEQTVIQHENCDQNTTDEQTVIQHENCDQTPRERQSLIHQDIFDPTDAQLIQQQVGLFGQGLLFTEEDSFHDIGKRTELFIRREILETIRNYPPTFNQHLDQVSESTQKTML